MVVVVCDGLVVEAISRIDKERCGWVREESDWRRGETK